MAEERRLKRGLGDVSPLWFSRQSPLPAVARAMPSTHETQSEEPPSLWSAPGMSLAILPLLSWNQLLSHADFVGRLRSVFSDLHVLELAGKVSKEPLGPGLHRFIISSQQVGEILDPASDSDNGAYKRGEGPTRMCCLIGPEGLLAQGSGFFELLAALILHVRTDSVESVLAAYQAAATCARMNPEVILLLMVEGKDAEVLAEALYERFASISSRFLAQGITLLGWIDGQQVCMNEEALTETNIFSVGHSLKRRLWQFLQSETLLQPSLPQ
jgi:hypothetical protein